MCCYIDTWTMHMEMESGFRIFYSDRVYWHVNIPNIWVFVAWLRNCSRDVQTPVGSRPGWTNRIMQFSTWYQIMLMFQFVFISFLCECFSCEWITYGPVRMKTSICLKQTHLRVRPCQAKANATNNAMTKTRLWPFAGTCSSILAWIFECFI